MVSIITYTAQFHSIRAPKSITSAVTHSRWKILDLIFLSIAQSSTGTSRLLLSLAEGFNSSH